MQAVQTPVIPVVAKLISDNPGTISLGQGVVNYGPPEAALEKIQQIKLDGDIHKYGPTAGLPELRKLIKLKLSRENRIETDEDYRIVVTAGSNMAFLNALFAITDPGDEIILSIPYYFNHEMAVTMLSCIPRLVPVKKNYQLDIKSLEAAINNRTKAIVTISPNNPAGAVYPESDLREINRLCRENGLFHINDEAYEYFTYNNRQHYSPGSCPEAKRHTISLYSLSKSYGFANWRIGYMVIPAYLYESVLKAQDTNLICPDIAAQYAAIGALEMGAEYCKDKLISINNTREILLSEINQAHDYCDVPCSDGAFYLFARLNSGENDFEIVKDLINHFKVAVLPGSAFGIRNACYIRIAYGALNTESAVEGIKRLLEGLKTIIGKSKRVSGTPGF